MSETAIGMRPYARSLPMALLRAREAVMREFRPLFGAHDLTEQQWRVLRALAAEHEPVDAGELVDRTALLGPSLSRILVALVTRGLVASSPTRSDRRRSAITITATGLELVATIGPQSESRYAALEARLGPGRLAQLEELLEDLARS